MVRIVHRLCRSREGGWEGHRCRGMREVGEWGGGHGSGAPGAARLQGCKAGGQVGGCGHHCEHGSGAVVMVAGCWVRSSDIDKRNKIK
jgi:hypothetical protein